MALPNGGFLTPAPFAPASASSKGILWWLLLFGMLVRGAAHPLTALGSCIGGGVPSWGWFAGMMLPVGNSAARPCAGWKMQRKMRRGTDFCKNLMRGQPHGLAGEEEGQSKRRRSSAPPTQAKTHFRSWGKYCTRASGAAALVPAVEEDVPAAPAAGEVGLGTLTCFFFLSLCQPLEP